MPAVRAFALPDLGEGLVSAEVVRWFVDVGDVIVVDQPVAEVETAKAIVEVPCPFAGVVTSLAGPAGTGVPVGAPLITVAVDHSGQDDTGGAPSAGPGNILVGYGVSPEPDRRRPRRRRPAGSGGIGDTGGSIIPIPRPETTLTLISGHGATGAGASSSASEAPADAPAGAGALAGASAGTAGMARADGRTTTGGTGGTARADGLAPARADGTAAGGPGWAGPVAVVSPLVRRLARDHAVDLRTLRGSGPDGLIMRRDVEEAISAGPSTLPIGQVFGRTFSPAAPLEDNPSINSHDGAGGGAVPDGAVVAFDALRRRAAEAFTRSRAEVPDATCWVDADATGLLAAKNALNAGGAEPRIGLLSILARVCVAALLRAPELNSSVVTDGAGRATGVRHHDGVHLGFAAQTPRGLVVPVVRDAHRRTTAELAAEITRLTAAARVGRLTPSDLTGGTFTLNNYGVFGVDGATPIIHHPQTSMLGVGRIVARPWVVAGELTVRDVVQLSFTFDHRVCDGATAGAFLRFVADAAEDPTALLRHL
ncbi:2-oxoisovalerate dehydrogenase E2 component (dihydrolipoyl transacylase) [Frankia sp. AiPs1]|uniref:dihydrolipoamide acetyltransferase family protein n=1 Tax=Frankia sp. AiPa1 TaxID=573492 RepID=UPI00202B8191|nr:dihydrolipoamide acetyltransferase family protein [Frankia sp. AiPa1]MCL9759553.1 2-oxo acid dehydrogenase subunit E2 [Frankia sp. AiPa1]